MIPVNNELGSCGGTGVALKYQFINLSKIQMLNKMKKYNILCIKVSEFESTVRIKLP